MPYAYYGYIYIIEICISYYLSVIIIKLNLKKLDKPFIFVSQYTCPDFIMTKKEKIKPTWKATAMALMVMGAIFFTFFAPLPMLEQQEDDSVHITFGGLFSGFAKAEGDPGAGDSGFLEIYFPNHTATPGTAYDENTSATIEGWCETAHGSAKTPYATADAFDVELKKDTAFDIVVRVRYNKTHAWDGAKFIGTHCRVNITLTGDIVISDVTGTNVESLNNTGKDYIWINVYWDNSGSGYELNKNEEADITEISIEGYY